MQIGVKIYIASNLSTCIHAYIIMFNTNPFTCKLLVHLIKYIFLPSVLKMNTDTKYKISSKIKMSSTHHRYEFLHLYYNLPVVL